MIVGDGDLAGVLPQDDKLYFASGVSNSKETRLSEFKREVDLLLEQPKSAHIVYFSSIGVLDGNSHYYRHKRYMEVLIKETFPTYTIIRIGNIDWGINPHTLINYLRAHPEAEIQDVYRYIISKEEFLYWVDKIPAWSCELMIVGRRLKIKEIRDEYTKR